MYITTTASILLLFCLSCQGADPPREQVPKPGGDYSFTLELEDQDTIPFEDHLRNTLDYEHDLFYAILGHPHDQAATKRQLDNYALFSRLFYGEGVPAKSATLNADMPPPNIEPEHEHDSYFGSSDWLVDYGREELKITYDHPQEVNSHNFDYIGVMVHSWADCIENPPEGQEHQPKDCLRILQVRNYAHFYPHNITIAQLGPVFEWITRQMDRHHNEAQLIVFQEFDEQLQAIVDVFAYGKVKPEESKHVVGILFTLMVRNTTVPQRTICQTNDVKIPVIAFTEIHPEHFLVIHYDPMHYGTTKHLYSARAHDDDENEMRLKEIMFEDRPCF